LVTGLLLVAVGVVFLRTNGMAALPDLVPTELLGRWQNQALEIAAGVPDALLVAVLAAVALGLWWVTQRRSSTRVADDEPDRAGPDDRTGDLDPDRTR